MANTERRTLNPLETKVGRKIALTTVLLFGATSLAACSGNVAPTPPDSQSVDAPDKQEPVSNETEAPSVENNMGSYENDPAITVENKESRLAELQFSADMTGEALGEQYNDTANSWIMAGATPDTFYDWMDAGLPDLPTFTTDIAEENAEVYATALFGADYQDAEDEFIRNAVVNITEANAKNLEMFLATYGDADNPNPYDPEQEAWHLENKLVSISVEQENDTSSILVVRRETQTNSEKNAFKEEVTNNGHQADTYLTFVKDENDPSIKVISDMNIIDVQ